VAAPEAQYLAFAAAWIAASLLMPLAVLAFRRRLLRGDRTS
jgi:hypothetical protein